MRITTHEHPAITTLAHHLSIDPNLLNRPEAQAARQRGLLRAKTEALKSAEHLVGWARPLLVGVLIVSFLHLWHQIARIAPTEIPPLSLPAWTHWLSAALLTISVDATALYLMATRSTAQYARLGGQGSLAVWFFYILTAALNSLFVLSYTPNLPHAVQSLTPALALIGAILLGLLVPISIAALERARQVTEIARLALLVEVETLRGLTTSNPEKIEPVAESYSEDAPAAPNTVHAEEEEQTNAFEPIKMGIPSTSLPVLERECPNCGTPLNMAQYGAAIRWGGCPKCRDPKINSSTEQGEEVAA